MIQVRQNDGFVLGATKCTTDRLTKKDSIPTAVRLASITATSVVLNLVVVLKWLVRFVRQSLDNVILTF